jgi:hypothetical protein
MLKFTYSETGITLEHLSQSIEQLMAQRAVLAVRTQTRMLMEPCSASFLLPADLDQLHTLRQWVSRDRASEAIALSVADADYVEVSVQGLWLCSKPEPVDGIFVLSLPSELEAVIAELWSVSQFCVSTTLG